MKVSYIKSGPWFGMELQLSGRGICSPVQSLAIPIKSIPGFNPCWKHQVGGNVNDLHLSFWTAATRQDSPLWTNGLIQYKGASHVFMYRGEYYLLCLAVAFQDQSVTGLSHHLLPNSFKWRCWGQNLQSSGCNTSALPLSDGTSREELLTLAEPDTDEFKKHSQKYILCRIQLGKATSMALRPAKYTSSRYGISHLLVETVWPPSSRNKLL